MIQLLTVKIHDRDGRARPSERASEIPTETALVPYSVLHGDEAGKRTCFPIPKITGIRTAIASRSSGSTPAAVTGARPERGPRSDRTRHPCCTTRDARAVPYPTMVTPSFPEFSPGSERTIESRSSKEWGAVGRSHPAHLSPSNRHCHDNLQILFSATLRTSALLPCGRGLLSASLVPCSIEAAPCPRSLSHRPSQRRRTMNVKLRCIRLCSHRSRL
jgi:hypothetical protein